MADPNSNTMVPFRREGNNIYSNETDKCVAVIDEDGTLKVQYGYNAMTPRIKAFLNEDAENKNDIFENTAPLKEPDLPLQNDSPANDDRAPDTQLQPEHAIDGGTGNTNVFVGNPPMPQTAPPPADLDCGDDNADTDDDKLIVESIPEEDLPDLDCVHGINTKSFRFFCKHYKLSESQITLLVKRIELKMRG